MSGALARGPLAGVLLDTGGVLTIDDHVVPGAPQALAALHRSGLALLCLTNTTRRPLRSLLARLEHLGLSIEPEEVMMLATKAPLIRCRRQPSTTSRRRRN